MDQVEYGIDPNADFPRYYSGEVVVTLDDGRTLRERVAVNRGNPERPLANEEIEAKFFENCALTMSEDAARRVRDQVLALDRLSNVVELEATLSDPEKR
jgi:2-methylcitrate dehydratase PrpD